MRQATQDLGFPGLTPAAIHAMRACSFGGKRLVSIADHLLVSRQAAAQVIEGWLVHLRDGRLEQLCSDLEELTEPPGARWRNLGD